MKKTCMFLGAWASGYMIHASYPYMKAMTLTNEVIDSHSFSQIEAQYSQPKIIDFLHNSPDKHFLHNLIVQDEKAFNLFKVYLPKDEQPSQKNHHLYIVFNAAEELQGNDNEIHSGLLATMIDNAFGQLSFLASGFIPAVTANLHIDCKQAIRMNEDYLIKCSVEKVDGRKVYLKADVYDKDKNLCSSANALFLTVNWGGKQWKDTLDTIQQSRVFSEGVHKFLFQ